MDARLTQFLGTAGEIIDAAVAAFAPRAALDRRLARAESKRYAAALPTRLGQKWRPRNQPVNDLITTSAPVLNDRIHQLCRDFPPFVRALNVITDYSVGTGLTFQSRVKGRDGTLDTGAINRIEEAWERWSDEADPAGRIDFGGLQRLVKFADTEMGEYVCVLQMADMPGRYLPAAIQVYEPDWLTSTNAKGADGKALTDDALLGASLPDAGIGICGGIEYDRATGIPLAYHMSNPYKGVRAVPVRIPAQYVIHGLDVRRPGQMHGVSPLVAAVMLAKDIGEYMNAEIDAAQMAAKWLAFVETGDMGTWQGLRVTEENGDCIEQVQNAIIEYLKPGEKMNFKDANRPGTSFEPFVKFILRLMAIAAGISYELISGDYSGLSYTNLRAIRNDMIRGFKPHIARHRFQFCRRVQRWFMDFAVLDGRLYLPNYFSNKAYYQRALWLPPGYESIDPLREGNADIAAAQAGLKSPQEIAAARGRDYEEILDEIYLARKLAADKGLAFDDAAGAPVKTNPAAQGAPETEE